MKYASGEEPMVGDVVECVEESTAGSFGTVGCVYAVSCVVVVGGEIKFKEQNRRDGSCNPFRFRLVRPYSARLPFLDGSDVFHVAEKPDSRFDEGGMYRSECTVYQSELDTLREKLRAAEAKLEAVREAVR